MECMYLKNKINWLYIPTIFVVFKATYIFEQTMCQTTMEIA